MDGLWAVREKICQSGSLKGFGERPNSFGASSSTRVPRPRKESVRAVVCKCQSQSGLVHFSLGAAHNIA